MQCIDCKDLFYLIRETLKLFDRRPIVHGGKVAYYVYKMLQYEKEFGKKTDIENFELADIVFLTTFHDIGAYKTDNIDQMIQFETKTPRAHSVYGHLFLEKMTPFGDLAKVILYHHTDYTELSSLGFEFSELASYINFAEAVDIFRESLGDKFGFEIFEKNVGKKFSPEAFDLFKKANTQYKLFEQISSGDYKQEINELMDFFILSNDDKEKLLVFLMFTLSLKSDIIVKNTAICMALCEKLGIIMKLNGDQLKILRYAACVHDIGYIAFNKEWLSKPPDLSSPYLEKLAQHTVLMEQLLKDKMKRDVIVTAATHHERIDGKGYPRRLTEKQLNLSQLLLQFADGIAATIVSTTDKEAIIAKVKRQTESGWFSPAITKLFLTRYDDIMPYVEERSAEILEDLIKINEQYETV